MSIAPLPTLDDLKIACHVELTDASQDGVIAALGAAAESIIQLKTYNSVGDTLYVEVDDTPRTQPMASFSPPTSLWFKHRCIDVITTPPVVTAMDGSTVDPTTYRVDPLVGVAYGNYGIYFGFGPYTMTYHAGLIHHPQWTTLYRAIAAQAIRDITAWLFSQPNPGVKVVAAGGGVSESYVDGLPGRICQLLSALPGGAVALGLG